MRVRTWHVELFLVEHDDGTTAARAVLHTGALHDKEGVGHASRAPSDGSVPENGEEVAVARALRALSDAVLAAAGDGAAMEHDAMEHDAMEQGSVEPSSC